MANILEDFRENFRKVFAIISAIGIIGFTIWAVSFDWTDTENSTDHLNKVTTKAVEQSIPTSVNLIQWGSDHLGESAFLFALFIYGVYWLFHGKK
jgi:hypothetical protein